MKDEITNTVHVPDRRRRIIPKVVLAKARGSWGSGNLEGGGFGQRVGQGR